MERSAVLIMITLLLTGLAAGANATDEGLVEESTLQIPIDEVEDISPRIENQLSVNDTITLRLTGRSIDTGLISWNVTETSYLTCNDVETVCNISMDAMSSQEIYISLQGTMVGQGSLIVEGLSEWTELSAQDSVQISVIPRTAEGVRQASGVDIIHLFVLAGVSSLLYAVIRRS